MSAFNFRLLLKLLSKEKRDDFSKDGAPFDSTCANDKGASEEFIALPKNGIFSEKTFLNKFIQALKKNPILTTSLAITIGLHALGLYFLISHPMILRYSLRSLFGLSTAAPEYLDIQEDDQWAKKNQILEDTFEHVLVLSPHLQQPFDLVDLPYGIAIAPNQEALSLIDIPHLENESDFLLQEPQNTFEVYTFNIDTEVDPLELISVEIYKDPLTSLHFQVDSAIASYDIEQIILPMEDVYIVDPLSVTTSYLVASQEPAAAAHHIAEHLITRTLPLNDIPLDSEEKPIEFDTSLGVHKLNEHVPFLPHPPLTKMHALKINVASLDENFDEEYLSSVVTTTAEWNEDFDLDICFLPNPEGKGYIFSLTLNPNFDISQYSLKHDVLFIIDRSTPKHRFGVFKRAVIKALSSLQQGDSFNIYVIDKKMTRFNAKSLPVNQKTLRAAEYFLEKQENDAFFAQGDIYSSLEKILPEIKGNDSVHSAILITDGVAQLSTRKQQQVLRNWIEKNNGNLCVYTAAVGQKNDLIMLDFLSSISGGKLLWSDTHAAFPRKLAKLVLDLKDPVATDLIIDAIPISSDAHVTLPNSFFQSPTLFSHRPYVIMGSIDKPGPFDLIIQGRHREQWIAIKKTVSFIDGTKGDSNLLKQWAAQKSHHSYAKFLNDGRTAHLKEARDILKKSRTEIAFE